MSTDSDFEQFVAERYAALVRLAHLLLADTTQSEDLVQAALIRTYSHWSSLRSREAAEPYTKTTMLRLAVRNSRRSWNREIPTTMPPTTAVDDPTAALDLSNVVRRALAELPVKQRAVIVARFYLDMTEQETGRLLRCPIGTVKSRTFHALQSLRSSGLLADERPIWTSYGVVSLGGSPKSKNGGYVLELYPAG